MTHGVVCIIEKRPCIRKVKQFLSLLSKTTDDIYVCFVCNNFPEIRKLLKDSDLKDYYVYNNSGNVPYPIMLNQGLKNCSQHEYVTCFNVEYSIVGDFDWPSSIVEGDYDLGGFYEELFINTQDESINEIIVSATVTEKLDWLIEKMYGDRLIKVVNKNIFTVKSESLKTVGYLKNIDKFMLELNLRFYSNKLKVVSLKDIYSVDNDFYRRDIFRKFNQGAKLLYPVIISKIRQKFVDKLLK